MGPTASFSGVANDLLARATLPSRSAWAELGLLRYGNSEEHCERRKRALAMSSSATIRATLFRFIIYSQWADAACGRLRISSEAGRADDFARLMASECLAVRVRRLGRRHHPVYDAALAPHGVHDWRSSIS